MKVSIVIPTYRRDEILLNTIRYVSALLPRVHEIIVADQTEHHDDTTKSLLDNWNAQGLIRFLRLPAPSVTCAMNTGLVAATGDVVLFLDDDIIPDPGLAEAHRAAHRDAKVALVAGRVIQPWHESTDRYHKKYSGFASNKSCFTEGFMGGNFSICRKIAIELGGFDENFVRVAYNFEAEFAHRLHRAGHRIFFEPKACIRHLKASSGGTRTFGDHLKTAKGDHAVGAYYYILRTWCGWFSLRSLATRPIRAVTTRHHLRRPWWIPFTLFAELHGLIWAIALALKGPRYIGSELPSGETV